ncbi:hypothetical protein HG702_09375 [Pectobacterium versatile]|nr:hypothetical protein [Pectobacterium versatile]QQK71693.1 hypothetical protein HG702_09375 [Pectobacterium versatile]
MAAGHKVRFPTAICILALLHQQIPAVVYPVVSVNQPAIAVVPHFRYLVAIPQVAGLHRAGRSVYRCAAQFSPLGVSTTLSWLRLSQRQCYTCGR